MLTVAPVLQIGPDDVFLREAEHAQAPASHTGVNDHTSVRHQIWTLKEASPSSIHKVKLLSQFTQSESGRVRDEVYVFVPDVSNLRPVLEEPAVGNLVFPADVPGILPQ